MSRYLTRNELAELGDCQPRSLTCMKRWLERNRLPYVATLVGVPRVAADYYEAGMNGAVAAAAPVDQEPDFAALNA